LRHPIVQKRLDFFKANGDENYESSLLQTIRIPKNLLFLTDRLPGANYEKIQTKKNLSFQKDSLPQVPNSKQKKVRESRKQDRTNDQKSMNQGSIDYTINNKELSQDAEALNKYNRNVMSLQPNRNEEIEGLKKKLRKDEKSDDNSNINNIKIIKSDNDGGYNMIKDERNVLLPNLPNIKQAGSVNYEIKYDPSPRKK
jgi:NIMA (never in mitosis gene a)-related kinase